MQFIKSSVLCALLAIGAVAQVTETATPNAQEYAQIKSDIAEYDSALVTQSLYLAAKSYVAAHSTSVPAIGVQLHTEDWAQGVSSLNALVTTSFPASFPTIVAQLYQSALEEQADIINEDLAQTTVKAAIVTGTAVTSAGFNTSTTFQSPTLATSTGSASGPTATGAGNAQVAVNGLILIMGLGVAALI